MLIEIKNSALLIIDVQSKLLPKVVNSEIFLENCCWLVRLAKQLSVECYVTEQYPKGLAPTAAELAVHLTDSPAYEKTLFSAHAALPNNLTKSQIIICGMEAHVCVLQTAFHLLQANKQVFVVVDAITSSSKENTKYALKRMQQWGAEIITKQMVLFEWLRDATHPQFKEISQTFLK